MQSLLAVLAGLSLITFYRRLGRRAVDSKVLPENVIRFPLCLDLPTTSGSDEAQPVVLPFRGRNQIR